jgi:RNA polymerase sigma-70 factor, ECF subfamily
MEVDSNAVTAIATPPDVDRAVQFWELVSTQRERAIGLAYHLTGDRDAALDIVQDAFLRAHRALPGFRGESALSTWFFRILVNQAKNYRLRRWLRARWQVLWTQQDVAPIDTEGVSRERAPDSSASAEEIRGRVLRALEELSRGQREAFVLVHLEGHTIAESAALLGISTGSVKTQLHRAMGKLRVELSDLREGTT